MKNNYSSMDSDQLKTEYKRLNKKLIFPNILITIIAIFAFVAQMFMPFFQVTLTLNSDVASAVIDMVFEDNEEIISSSDNDILSTVVTKTNLKKMTTNLNSSFTLQLAGSDLLSLAFASDETIEDEIVMLLADVIDDMNVKEVLENALNDMMPSIISTVVTSVVSDAIISGINENAELTEAQKAIIETAAARIETSVQKLAEAENIEDVKEEVKTEVQDSISSAMADLEFSEEDIASSQETIDTYYDEFLNSSVDEDGNFSYLTLIGNADTIGSSDSSSETAASISYYLSLLDDSEALVREILGEDSLDESTLSTIKTVSLISFIVITIVAALWAILAIFAFLHIFLPNKKVGMWYVKSFGGLVAVVFFLAPVITLLFADALVPTLASAFSVDSSMISTILGAISFGGAGILILIFMLVLWLVSIFWCHPIKKRIKLCRKLIKRNTNV